LHRYDPAETYVEHYWKAAKDMENLASDEDAERERDRKR
jgi:hypothetical protein